MDFKMNKYFKILLFNLVAFMGCEELKGSMGPAGQDGAVNMHIGIIQLTPNNTQFVDYDFYSSGTSGFLEYENETSYLATSVLDSGLDNVNLSTDDRETWNSLPYLLYDGNNDGVNYVYKFEYNYT